MNGLKRLSLEISKAKNEKEIESIIIKVYKMGFKDSIYCHINVDCLNRNLKNRYGIQNLKVIE